METAALGDRDLTLSITKGALLHLVERLENQKAQRLESVLADHHLLSILLPTRPLPILPPTPLPTPPLPTLLLLLPRFHPLPPEEHLLPLLFLV